MPRYELTAPDGRTVVVEGDTPPTQEDAARIFAQIQVKPERTFGEKVGGAFDAAANMVTGAVAQPVSGLVGLANLAVTQNPESAAARQQQVESALTYRPGEVGQEYLQNIGQAPVIKQIGETAMGAADYAGRKTFEATGSPLAASVAQALPETVGAALGAATPGGIATRQATKTGERMVADIGSQRAGATIDDVGMLRESDTGKALRSGKVKTIESIIDSNPEFYRAIDRLGVTQEPLASYASRNPQFRGIEQSFAAIPSSPQAAQAERFAKDVSNMAQALLEKGGASLDSVQKSLDWRDASMRTINELGDAAEESYKALDGLIDKKVPVTESGTMQMLSSLTEDLALGIDDPDVPKVLKDVYKSLQPRQIETDAGVQLVPPTYANLDLIRKKVGAAAFKNEGDFKDADSALLKRLYSSLSDDVNRIAEQQGLGEQVKAAKSLVAQRKQLEEQMQNVVGNNLQKDIIPVVQQGIRGLSKGGAKKYQEIMRNIPDPEMRKELITTALNDMFTKTLKGDQQFGTTDYIKWYNSTLKNDSVRNLIGRDLAPETMQVLDDLATVAEGIAKATSQRIPTGVVNAVLNDDTGFVRRMVGTGGRIVGATPLMQEAGNAIMALAERGTKRAEATANLLSSPEFLNTVRRGVALGVADGKKASEAVRLAEKRLINTAKYKDWESTLKPEERAKLNAVGLAAFLLAPEQEEQK